MQQLSDIQTWGFDFKIIGTYLKIFASQNLKFSLKYLSFRHHLHQKQKVKP